MKNSTKKFPFLLLGTIFCLLLFGCATPSMKPGSNRIDPDEDKFESGITSGDLRTIASRMTPTILGLPEIAKSASPMVIKIAEMKNTSRFFFDRNLVTKLLRVELNRYSRGRIRFINENARVMESRMEIQDDLQEELVQAELKKLAKEIASFPAFQPVNGKKKTFAVLPVLNTNLINMNADSFANILRSEIVMASGGRIQFLLPGHEKGADYYLTGLFYPESMKKEGIINLAEYIHVINRRINSGRSLDLLTPLYSDDTPNAPYAGNYSVPQRENILKKMLRDPGMRSKPNVNNRFNVMIAEPATKIVAFEKNVMLNRKVSTNARKAGLILSGEISGLSKRRNGLSSDYLVITLQLTDPRSNMILWEDSYEVKRLSRESIVYR